MRPKRESDILCDVIDAYKDEDFSEYSDEVSDEENPYIKEPRTTAICSLPVVIQSLLSSTILVTSRVMTSFSSSKSSTRIPNLTIIGVLQNLIYQIVFQSQIMLIWTISNAKNGNVIIIFHHQTKK
jgi:hypothetical protein